MEGVGLTYVEEDIVFVSLLTTSRVRRDGTELAKGLIRGRLCVPEIYVDVRDLLNWTPTDVVYLMLDYAALSTGIKVSYRRSQFLSPGRAHRPFQSRRRSRYRKS